MFFMQGMVEAEFKMLIYEFAYYKNGTILGFFIDPVHVFTEYAYGQQLYGPHKINAQDDG